MSPVLGYTSWKYSHHGNTALRSPSDTIGILPVCPRGQTWSVHTNMYKVFAPTTNYANAVQVFWKGCWKETMYFIELGKHWHPSFPMENIVVFCSHCSPPCWCKHQHFNSSVGWEPVSHYNISEGNYGYGRHSKISFVLQYAGHILCTYPYTLLHCIYFTTVDIFPPSFHILCTYTVMYFT